MALNFANNNSLSAISSLPASISGGAMNLISTQTASSSSTISFTSGIDDTYDEYVFKFYNIHPSAADTRFQVNFRDGGSSYDATKTTTFFRAYHGESDDATNLGYDSYKDLAQSTASHNLNTETGNQDADKSLSGQLQLFSPSSTVFVKHFMSVTNDIDMSNYCITAYTAGYCNVNAAIDGVQFSFSSGDIDSGVIKLYGIS